VKFGLASEDNARQDEPESRALGDLEDHDSFAELVACLAAPVSHEWRNAVQALMALGDERMRASTALPAMRHMMQTDTNEETTIHGLYVLNSSVARMAIATILSGQQPSELDWPS
jgi:hypothetical protein